MKRIAILRDENASPAKGIDFSGLPYYALRKDYVDLVVRSGGLPIIVPYDDQVLDKYIDLCDGFVLVGGTYAFHKHWYEAVPDTFLENLSHRRNFEIVFTQSVLTSRKPVLGICCGMQVMCGVNGSKIFYDLDEVNRETRILHRSDGKQIPTHYVNIDPGSRLYEVFARERLLVNSAHREGVIHVSPAIVVSATSDDGLIEAIELPDHPFAIGVQWHPELGAGDDKPQKQLFDALMKAL